MSIPKVIYKTQSDWQTDSELSITHAAVITVLFVILESLLS